MRKFTSKTVDENTFDENEHPDRATEYLWKTTEQPMELPAKAPYPRMVFESQLL